MEPIDVTSDPVRSAVAPDPVRSERLLRATTDEAVRLLGADGALVYLLRPTGGLVYLLRPGIPRPELAAEASAMNAAPDHWLGAIRIEVGAGMLGVAVAQRRVVVTGSYRDDPGFGHTEQADTFASEIGLQSLIVAPLVAGEDVFGALGVYRRDADAFGAQQVALVRALADHAALAMANARLIAELDRARLATTRQADVERSLRELGTRISGASDLAAVVQHTIDEAQRLLGGDGGRIDTIDRETNALRGIYTSGREISEVADWPYDPDDSLEVGVSGRAVITARTSITPDYLADTTIVHGPGPDSYARAKGIRSVISSPLVGEDGVFGAITVWSIRADAFDADDASLLETIAGQGAVALVRARLIEDLGRSREELARRVDEERALYDLARRSMMASGPAGPAGVLADVAGVAARLLGPLGAVIDVTGPAPAGGATHRVAGADGADGAHVAAWRAETGDEAIARAIAGRHVVTGGSRPDGAGPVRSWAVAPLIGESAVWGTITVFSGEADRYETGDTELLGALADHATIALAGADLVGRLEESDDRYRSLIENLPDLVFTCAADGTLTFLSESAEALLGRPAKDLIGMHFRDLVSPRPDGAPAGDRFQELMLNPTHKITTRFELITAFGFNRPVEVTAAPIVRDGRFAGIQGSARDIGERERLERELRESDARYRYLVESSPDLVWMTDADGRLTYLSDRSRPVVGWDPAELIGRSFADLARTGERRAADTRFSWLRRHPTEPHRDRIRIVDRDGVERLVEVTAIGMLQDGVFVGAHGAARDIRELVRLEADLRRQAAELAAAEERAHLARELHDSVTQALFSMTLQSRSLELLLARDPGQLAARIGELRDLQRDALAEMRALIFELRPGNVVEHGVVEALRTHAAGVSARLGLPIVVESDLPVRPAIETEEALYRIAQEALHNIVKHAGAREARVELVRLGPDVRLRVVDDGHGFDPDAVPDGHLGLAGMRARAERLAGTFSVASAPGRGTKVQATVPNVPPAWGGRTLSGAGVGSGGTGRRA